MTFLLDENAIERIVRLLTETHERGRQHCFFWAWAAAPPNASHAVNDFRKIAGCNPTEAFQGVVWYLIVSHPDIKRAQTRWEVVR